MMQGAVVRIFSSDWSMLTDSPYETYKPYITAVHAQDWKFGITSKTVNSGYLFDLFDGRNADNSSSVKAEVLSACEERNISY